MTGAEFKAMIPDNATIYVDGSEIFAEDVDIDKDGDVHVYTADEEEKEFEDEDDE